MAQTEKAIVRFRELFEQECLGDLAWAEELQERMRQEGLVHSGRPVSATLRPEVLSQLKFQKLAAAANRLSTILEQIEPLILRTPALLNRLGMLPGEKMLAQIPARSTHSRVFASMKAHRQNGSFRICDYNACGLHSLIYPDRLADLFLDLHTLQCFTKGRYKLSKVGGLSCLLNAIRQAWSDFGGYALPQVAILETSESVRSNALDGQLLEKQLSGAGLHAKLVSPDQLEYTHNRLHAGAFRIDLLLRRLLTRELLAAHNLSHPLFIAYRDGTVCIINNFQSGLTQRRSLFELLTDESILKNLSTSDAQFIRKHIPWTRVVGSRKVICAGQAIDLHQLALHKREHFILCPNDLFGGEQTFIGASMSESAWESALRMATRAPYVLQERLPVERQSVPLFQYGEIQRKIATASVEPQLFSGRMLAVSAAFETCVGGCEVPLTLAPILLLDPETEKVTG
ncbi:MAG: hypothetical protein JO182_15260 [Acidobacteriaceae bacterium]|nr:hypothetical protein [Acidobacteriaceae bacterium]MBV9306179.1 hypothetical protein [Acidobacteriaceae bacterium]